MALVEGGESEVATNDPEVNLAAPISDYNQVSSTFQSELYEALMRRSNADVTDFQIATNPCHETLRSSTLLPLLTDFN